MALLDRSDWYDIARTTNWTPRYATEEEIFPREMSDMFDLGMSQWEAFDEPFKISYREYVDVQSKKDADAYSVKAALARSKFYDESDPRWKSILKLHFGALCLVEYAAVLGEAKMMRFGKAPGMRNMATFGALDEMRHCQIQLFFAHQYVSKSRQFDFAYKNMHTNGWAAAATRSAIDDITVGRDAISEALTLTFAVEQAWTNLQFLGLAADAAKAGDFTFSNLISSVQTDESRHAQIGGAALKVLIANGKKKEAQQAVDISFWRNWRLFMTVSGPAIDYLTPLECRDKSFKEFVEEFVVAQYERALLDLGLDTPWYWDFFLDTLNYHHHSGHIEIWFVRQTLWWDPVGGVAPDERAWLEEKYPGWSDKWGPLWDVITENIRAGRTDKLFPKTIPMLCHTCGLSSGAIPGTGHTSNGCWIDESDRRYYFCTPVCKWIYEVEGDRTRDYKGIIERVMDGTIPSDMEGMLCYFGLMPGERGEDGHDYAWARVGGAADEAA
jgi:toluene monooxygenase system protein A